VDRGHFLLLHLQRQAICVPWHMVVFERDPEGRFWLMGGGMVDGKLRGGWIEGWLWE
jgi:hypothetical protein